MNKEIIEKLFNLALTLENDEKMNIDSIIDKFIHLLYKHKSEETIKLMERSLAAEPPYVNIFKIMKKYLERIRYDNIHTERQIENINLIKSLKPLELLVKYLKYFDLSKKGNVFLKAKLIQELEPLQAECNFI